MKGIQLIKKDLQSGVKLIKDKNYEPYCKGVTRYSLIFFNFLVKKGILSIEKVNRAELKFSAKHWYSLTLYTIDGYKFSFHGVTFGYTGEGSRASAEILRTCGFTQYNRVYDMRNHFCMTDMIKFYKKDLLSV